MGNLINDKVTVSKGILWLLGGISPLMVLGGSFYLGSFLKDMDGRTFESPQQRERIFNIVNDEEIHMPFRVKVKEFMPRTEVEYRLDDIDDDLDDIKKALRINN